MFGSKKRHNYLRACLILLLMGNLISAVINVWGSSAVIQHLQTIPSPAMVIMGLLSVFNLICIVALLKWKKWGFWGLITSSILALIVNLSAGMEIMPALTGVGIIVLLFFVLNVGKENKAWLQLN